MSSPMTLVQLQWPNGTVQLDNTYASDSGQGLSYDVKSGDKTPGFHSRVAKGEKPLPVNSYTRSVSKGRAFASCIRKAKFRRYLSGKTYPYDGSDYTCQHYITASPVSFFAFNNAFTS